MVQRRPQSHLDRFEIQASGLATVLEDDPKQTAYFAFDFLADRFRCFFSCALSVSASGRERQMSSLVSINVPLNCR
jgi:hypothetical protein